MKEEKPKSFSVWNVLLGRNNSSCERVFTLANVTTGVRVALAPFIGRSILRGQWNTALVGCIAGSATDALDGYIARRMGQITPLGAILDPLADKLFVGTTFLSLTLRSPPLIPRPLVALVLLRDASLLCGAMYRQYNVLPSRVVLHPSLLSKANTVSQMSYLSLLLLRQTLRNPIHISRISSLISVCQYCVAGTTLVSGIHYIYCSDCFSLRKKHDSKIEELDQ